MAATHGPVFREWELTVSSIAQRYQQVLERIDAACRRVGRNPSDVSVVCVTKTVGELEIREAVAAGAVILGENRVQDAVKKRAVLGDLNVEWHLIGHLQTNKAKTAVAHFDCIHSLDSEHVAEAVNKAAIAAGKCMPIYIQVNVSHEETKYGVDSENAFALIRFCRQWESLRIMGLMTMAPFVEDPEETRPVFRGLRELRDAINREFPDSPFTGLSMGMTNDFEVAVEEGATIVRIGSAIFR